MGRFFENNQQNNGIYRIMGNCFGIIGTILLCIYSLMAKYTHYAYLTSMFCTKNLIETDGYGNIHMYTSLN